MDSNKTATNGEDEIVLRDLQGLLRKSIGNEVIVVNYVTSSLLPPGENYGSTMLKVEAVIKRTKSSPEEKLPLVAKMLPTSDLQKNFMNATAVFGKEIYVIEKLAPAFRQLEKDMGVKEKDLIDIVPKFYGGRMSINNEDKADNDVVMLMENMKINGYYTMDRRQGLDFIHAKLALSELARFHALSMILRQRKPAFFQESQELMSILPFEIKDHEFDDVITHTLQLMLEDERVRKYEDRIRKVINTENGFETFMSSEQVEPWISIAHGDFWVNNMLFHKGKDGAVSDVKFIDFQLTKVTSPLKDLPYFICASVSPDVMDEHFDDLLNIYHKKFVEVLKSGGCDASPFTKEEFLKQLKKDANSELFHCTMALKFFTLDATGVDMNDIKANVMMTGGNELYRERCWKIVCKFIENEWI